MEVEYHVKKKLRTEWTGQWFCWAWNAVSVASQNLPKSSNTEKENKNAPNGQASGSAGYRMDRPVVLLGVERRERRDESPR